MTTKKKNVTKLPKRKAKKTSAKSDIVELILRDHKPLKRLIKVMKGEKGIEIKRAAFEEFAPTLEAHAKPEEQALYTRMKEEEDLRESAFEGDTEHSLANQLVSELKVIKDEDVWMAKCKVLAELVEHHIEEEEEEMLPDVKKELELEARVEAGEHYLQLRSSFVEFESDARLAS